MSATDISVTTPELENLNLDEENQQPISATNTIKNGDEKNGTNSYVISTTSYDQVILPRPRCLYRKDHKVVGLGANKKPFLIIAEI
jgi:hypothetical protein